MLQKKICGKYCEISNMDILNMARENRSWTFGEFMCDEAINIIELSRKYNIKIEMTDIDNGEKLL